MAINTTYLNPVTGKWDKTPWWEQKTTEKKKVKSDL